MIQFKNFTITAIAFFGMILFSSNAVAQQISDNEIKKNITAIDNALNRLVKLEPKSFTYDNSKYNYLSLETGKQYGFITEDIAQTFPELVDEKSVQYMFGKNVYRTAKVKMVDGVSLIPVLVASIKEQQLQIQQLKQEIEALKNSKVVVVN
ncbi:MAG: tail fiber domain-containing protein [Bacteroidota bacterium]